MSGYIYNSIAGLYSVYQFTKLVSTLYTTSKEMMPYAIIAAKMAGVVSKETSSFAGKKMGDIIARMYQREVEVDVKRVM